MNRMKLLAGIPVLISGLVGLLGASAIQAQITQEQSDTLGPAVQAHRDFYNKLSDRQRNALSGAALNFFHRIQNQPDSAKAALAAGNAVHSNALGALAPAPEDDGGPVRVSDPSTDFDFGPSWAFTQSETSTAWCGSNVVVAYNDSGSYWASGFATGFQHLSFNGYSTSTNRGQTFVDRGFLPSATANPSNFVEGDPVVACTDASTFFYASLFETVSSFSPYTPLTAISVSKSINAGVSFGAPVSAASKDAFTHFLDKPWMAINPANPRQIAVTYTDFDFSLSACPTSERTAIELAASMDGGNTWSAPQVVFEACFAPPNFASVQGSQVAFSPSGAVDVAFELFSAAVPTGNQIEFEQASSLGAAFGAPVAVANLLGVGDGSNIAGGIRAGLHIQGMAVDRSGLSTSGNIYVSFHDSTSFQKLFNGIRYNYSDAMLARSTDGGATWAAPVRVNTNPEPLSNGLGTDAYMPGVAVDNTNGHVGVCWYDRRNDPKNYRVDRFCGSSADGGATFSNFRVTEQSFPPIHAADDLVNPYYMGDYDAVASDTLQMTGGFIGAFQVVNSQGANTLVPNSDVEANAFK